LSPVPGGQGSLICWDACICQGFCGQDGGNGGGGGGGGPCTCPPHPNPGQVDTGCPQSEPNPCPGGFTSGGNWACWGTGTHSSTAGSAGECCAGSWSAVFVGHECD
jgi:hypothetical protein